MQNACGQGTSSGVGVGCYEDNYQPSTSLVRAPVCAAWTEYTGPRNSCVAHNARWYINTVDHARLCCWRPCVACSLHAGCCCSWWVHCAWHALTVVEYVDSGRPLGHAGAGHASRAFQGCCEEALLWHVVWAGLDTFAAQGPGVVRQPAVTVCPPCLLAELTGGQPLHGWPAQERGVVGHGRSLT